MAVMEEITNQHSGGAVSSSICPCLTTDCASGVHSSLARLPDSSSNHPYVLDSPTQPPCGQEALHTCSMLFNLTCNMLQIHPNVLCETCL